MRAAPRASGRAASRVPVLLGVLPLHTGRHAEFLHNEVPGITIPDEVPRGRCAPPASAAPRSGSRWPTRCWRPSAREVVGHVHHAQLRPLRAGRRAGPPDPRAPPDGGGRAPRDDVRARTGSPLTGGRRRRRLPLVLAALGLVPGAARRVRRSRRRSRTRRSTTRRGLPAGDGRAGRGDDRRHRAADRRRDRRLHAARPLLRDDRPGRARRAGPDGPVGRRPARVRRRPRDPVRPPRGRPVPRPGPAVRRARLRRDVPLQRRAPGDLRQRHAAAAQARATWTARCSRRCSKVDAAATPEHAAQLNLCRIINAALGLLGAPLVFVLLVGGALIAWLRYGRDPVYLDDPSIHMPAPPADLTAAAGAVVRDGKSTRRALTTAMLDLAARGLIEFDAEERACSVAPPRSRSTPRRRPPTTRSRWRGSTGRAPGRSTTPPRSCSSACARSAAGRRTSTPRSC